MPDTDFSKYASVNFRLGDRLNTMLSTRGDNLNTVAKRDLERYYDTLQACLPTFAHNEALLLCDALNGIICNPDTLWANIAASDEFCSAEKWDVTPGPFLEKIKMLSYVETLAVIDAVERVWNVREYGNVDLKKRVLLVGLVK
jgi:hypothetical protein